MKEHNAFFLLSYKLYIVSGKLPLINKLVSKKMFHVKHFYLLLYIIYKWANIEICTKLHYQFQNGFKWRIIFYELVQITDSLCFDLILKIPIFILEGIVFPGMHRSHVMNQCIIIQYRSIPSRVRIWYLFNASCSDVKIIRSATVMYMCQGFSVCIFRHFGYIYPQCYRISKSFSGITDNNHGIWNITGFQFWVCCLLVL